MRGGLTQIQTRKFSPAICAEPERGERGYQILPNHQQPVGDQHRLLVVHRQNQPEGGSVFVPSWGLSEAGSASASCLARLSLSLPCSSRRVMSAS